DQLVSSVRRDAQTNAYSSSSSDVYPNGNVLTETDGDGNTTFNTYEGDRLVSRVLKDDAGDVVSTEAWAYDGNGNVVVATDADGKIGRATCRERGQSRSVARDAQKNVVSSS